MSKIFYHFQNIIVFCLLFSGIFLPLQAIAKETNTSSDLVIIKIADHQNTKEVAKNLSETIGQTVTVLSNSLLTTYTKNESIISQIKANNSVVAVEKNHEYAIQAYTPDDPSFTNNSQWYLKDQIGGIYAQSGWEYGATENGLANCTESTKICGGKPTIKVAVIDTGVNASSIDFGQTNFDIGNSARFYDNGSQDCPNSEYIGYIENTYLCKSSGVQFDSNGHGTKVASIIAMSDNAQGGIGIAYNTTILPIALHGKMFSSLGLALAIDQALSANAQIINISLGTYYKDTVIESMVEKASSQGAIIVAASGNCAQKTALACGFAGADNTIVNPPIYPAAFDKVIAVGAVNYGGSLDTIIRSSYSSFGSYLDVVAPVGEVVANNSGVFTQDKDNSFKIVNGTSFAAPQVSAAIALLLSIRPNANLDYVNKVLQNSPIDLGTAGKDDQYGYGLLQIKRLMYAFPDVPFTYSLADYIYRLRDLGVIGGYPDGNFKPDEKVTRGQISKFIKRAFGFTTNTNCTPFSDVPATYTLYEDIMTLKCAGVIGGYADGTFRPDEAVRRDQTMKFAILGARIKAKGSNDTTFLPNNYTNEIFTDVPTTHILYEFVMAGYSQAIISGFGNGEFKPADFVTRAQVSKIIDNTRMKLP